jgi:Flp pilus assembly pilin Flp
MFSTKRFLKSETGVTALEYSLAASLIAIALLVAGQALRQRLIGVFAEVEHALPSKGTSFSVDFTPIGSVNNLIDGRCGLSVDPEEHPTDQPCPRRTRP